MISDLTGAPAARRGAAVFSRPGSSGHVGASRGGCAGPHLSQLQETRRGHRGRNRKHDQRAGGRLHHQSAGGGQGGIHDRSTDHGRLRHRGRRTRHHAGHHQRPALHVARPLSGGEPSLAGSHEQHDARQFERRNRNSRFHLHGQRSARPDGNSPRQFAAGEGSHGAAGRRGPGHRRGRRAKSGERLAPASLDSRGIRRHLQGAAEIVSRPGRGAAARAGADFPRAAVRVSVLLGAASRFFPRRFFRLRACFSRLSDHAHRRSIFLPSWG